MNKSIIYELTTSLMGAGYSIDIIVDQSSDFVQYMNGGALGVMDRRVPTRVILSGTLSPQSKENLEPLDFAQYRKPPFSSGISAIIVDQEEVVVFGPSGAGLFGTTNEVGRITNPEVVSNYVRHFEMLWDGSKEILYQDTTDEYKQEQKPTIISSIIDFEENLIEQLQHDPTLLHSLEPRKFEEVVERLLRKLGHHTTLTPATKDGGYDILSTYKTPSGIHLICLVECKRYAPNNPVGVNWVRSLYGVVEQQKANLGMLVTTSRFTSPAKNLQKEIGYRMDLKEFKDISSWINSTSNK